MAHVATLSELKNYLKLRGDASNDVLQTMLDSAEALTETYTGRSFRPDPALVAGADTAPAVTKVLPVHRRAVLVPDARLITAVTLDGETVSPISSTVTDGYATYGAPHVTTLVLPRSGYHVSITGRFGYYPPPPEIKDAVLAMAARRYRERDAGYGDAVQTPEGGVVSYFRSIPGSVRIILDAHRRVVA